MGRESPPRTHQWSAGTESIYERPALPYRRRDAVRVVLPGVDEEAARLEADNVYPLVSAIAGVLDQRSDLDAVELLVYPNDDGTLEHVLSAPTPRSRPADLGGQTPVDIADFGDDEGERPRWVEALTTNLEETLPASVGVEFGGLSFDTLGITPVATSQLVLEKNRAAIGLDRLTYRPFASAIDGILDADQPFVIQTIISRGSSKAEYLATMRLAVFDPEQAIRWEQDLHRHVSEGHPYDLADIWEPAGFTSNFQFPIEDFYRVGLDRLWPQRRNYRNWSDTRAAREIIKGHEAFRDLFGGRLGSNKLFSELALYPRFPLDRDELRLVASVLPRVDSGELWEAAPGRSAPRWHTRAVLTEALGTDQAITTEMGTLSLSDSTMANEGTRAHRELGALAEQVIIEQGGSVTASDQEADSHPDYVATLDGTEWAVEAELHNKTKRGHSLINFERAIEQDRGLYVITPSQKEARKLLDLLHEPFRKITEFGVHLYNQSDPVRLENGAIPVWSGDIESAWYLDADGVLSLRDGDSVIASGDAASPVATFDVDTYHYHDDEGDHRVVDPNGYTIAEYESRSALHEEWTSVRMPLVPSHFDLATCLEDYKLQYRSGGWLASVDTTPAWDVHAELSGHKMERYEGAFETMTDRYIRDEKGAELRFDAVYETFCAWFEARCDHEPPTKNVFGQIVDLETKRREVDGTYRKFFRDVTWVMPVGLRSPDLSFRTED